VLGEAADLARTSLLELADERSEVWEPAARRRLDAARAAFGKALTEVERRAAELGECWSELAVAGSSEARLRAKMARAPEPPGVEELRAWAAAPALPELLAEHRAEAS
jgi:hypothetical protein